MPLIPSKQEMGQGLVEYAIGVVLVGIVVIPMLIALGPSIANRFRSINSSMPTVSFDGIPVEINPTEAPTLIPTETPAVPPTETPTLVPTENSYPCSNLGSH